MNPPLIRIHQEIISEIHYKLKEYIKSNTLSCKVYPAPFDVILKNDDEEIFKVKEYWIINPMRKKSIFKFEDTLYTVNPLTTVNANGIISNYNYINLS